MATFSIGILLFLMPFALNIVLWRYTPISRTPKNIGLIFVASQVACLLIFLIRYRYSDFLTLEQYAHSCLVGSSIFLAYLLTYPAIESDSPSNRILIMLQKAGTHGLGELELMAALPNQDFVQERIRGLIRDSKVVVENDRISLTPEGKRFLTFFKTLRRLFTRKPLGG